MRAMLLGLDVVDERESLRITSLTIALKPPRNETYQLLRRILCKIRKLKVEALRKLENLPDKHKHAKPVCRSRPSATITITLSLLNYNNFLQLQSIWNAASSLFPRHSSYHLHSSRNSSSHQSNAFSSIKRRVYTCNEKQVMTRNKIYLQTQYLPPETQPTGEPQTHSGGPDRGFQDGLDHSPACPNRAHQPVSVDHSTDMEKQHQVSAENCPW